MKCFRTVACAVLCLLVLTSMAGAQGQPTQFVQVTTVTVRPEATAEYEDYVKKIIAGIKKIGAPQRVFAYQVASGGPGGTYLFSLPFNKWGEMDAWPSIPEILSKAYGEAEAAKILRAGRATFERSETAVYSLLTDLSTRPKVFDPPTSFALVIRTEIDPAMGSEYQWFLSKIKAAQEAEPSAPTAIRRASARGLASTYVTAQFFNKHAEVDGWPVLNNLLRKAYGEEEARHINEIGNRCVKKRELFTLAYRPDLSQPTMLASQ